MSIEDKGNAPYVVNIEELTKANDYFRQGAWTGTYFQMTLMSIEVGGEVGLEVHPDTDQFLRLEAGNAKVMMGPAENNLEQEWEATSDFGIFVPANTWHNIVNTGDEPLKIYSIYAPPHHPHGVVHQTAQDAADAEAQEHAE